MNGRGWMRQKSSDKRKKAKAAASKCGKPRTRAGRLIRDWRDLRDIVASNMRDDEDDR